MQIRQNPGTGQGFEKRFYKKVKNEQKTESLFTVVFYENSYRLLNTIWPMYFTHEFFGIIHVYLN